MILSANPMEKRLQIAGILLIIGRLIEAICLLWGRPISFVIFVAIGGVFLFAGVVAFLLSLVSTAGVQD
jgi:hypothetical protein